MNTPVLDFLRRYDEENVLRFHMPGHKGKSFLGPERWDITEVSGADSLYEAAGIIAESEANATALFGSQASFYSTEGSSQCIRAMLHLLISGRKEGAVPLILAARNVHKSFVYAAALLDFQVRWLWPEESSSLCSCPVSPESLDKALAEMNMPPVAVYITSPDYLGYQQDIGALAEVCHRHGTLLAVDNAHGAYLHFFDKPQHPLDLGADICCDSAHKTLPVLTGGAYLHISRNLPESFARKAKTALALFGSTSPSYLTMASLDACNGYLAGNYRDELSEFCRELDDVRLQLSRLGYCVEHSDPLRLCLRTDGKRLAGLLREKGIECEYADNDHIVFMFTPENTAKELEKLVDSLYELKPGMPEIRSTKLTVPKQCVSIREAVMAESETVPAEMSEGRICAAPLVSCPPAIPIVISGELITREAVELLCYYGMDFVEVLK